MKVYTQNDFVVAVIATSLRTSGPDLDEATIGFLDFIKSQRSAEEKLGLVERADNLEQSGESLPTPEELRKLSEIWTDLPRDEWELLEIQSNAH